MDEEIVEVLENDSKLGNLYKTRESWKWEVYKKEENGFLLLEERRRLQ